jgi:phosphopantothenoylcysteine decarboxylase/phosphopantothenate--cysteine ligase
MIDRDKIDLTETTPLAGRTVLLGVSGSIAAYKAADLCSRLGKLGAQVHVVLTPNASRFVGPATFQALTRNPVMIDVFDEPHARRIAHIELAQTADLVVVAPASADVMARMACGLADDMLTTCLLATPATTPVLIAPAMNTAMWEHPATVANCATLRARGVELVQPGHGLLACQDVGYGKLAEVDEIVRAISNRLTAHQDYAGVRLLITAGATREPLDPVRFLSNRSSGKMGYALAAAAQARGATVTLVSGFATVPAPPGVHLVRIETADQMLDACRTAFSGAHALIAAAAVADYAPAQVASHKIKKPGVDPETDRPTLILRRTPHILATLAAERQPGQVVAGFAAETRNLVAQARSKPYAASLDLIVANDVSAPDAGFDVDTNRVTFLWPDGRTDPLPLLTKREVADRILTALRPLLPPTPH